MIKFRNSDINLWLSTILPAKKIVHVSDPAVILINDEALRDTLPISDGLKVLLIMSGKETEYNADVQATYDVVLDFTCRIKLSNFSRTTLSILGNENDYVKWIFKKSTLNFSRLYQRNTRADKLRFAKYQLFNFLKLDRLFIHGSCHVFWKKDLQGNPHLKHVGKSYAYSSGSHEYGASPTVYYKIASEDCFVNFSRNGYTKNLLHNQLLMADVWREEGFNSIIMPRIEKYSKTANISIGNHPVIASDNFSLEHGRFVTEIIDKTIKQYKFNETPMSLTVKHNIELLLAYKSDNIPYFKYFSDSLIRLHEELKQSRTLFSFCYGDLTPWTSGVAKDKLYLFNFSHSASMNVILFDFFHFVFQNEGLVKNQDWTSIKKKIDSELKNSGLIDLVEKWAIDVNFYLKHYLLSTISQNLGLISFQSEITDNQLKSISIWKEALAELTVQTVDERVAIYFDLNHFLSNYRHTFLHQNEESTGTIERVEVLINAENQAKTIHFLNDHPYVNKVDMIKKRNGTQVVLNLLNQNTMTIELRTQFIENGVKYIDPNLVLNSSKKTNGILVPDSRITVECHLLTCALASRKISEKIVDRLNSFSRAEQEIIQNYLNLKYDLSLSSFSDILKLGDEEMKRLREFTRKGDGFIVRNFRKILYRLPLAHA